MYNDSIEITLFSLLLCCILTIIIVITIINYNYNPNDLFSTLYIQSQPDNNDDDNNKGEEDDKKEGKEDTEKKKEKDKKTNKNVEEKKLEIKEKEEKSEEEENDTSSWTYVDKDLITKYNYRNLAIPKIYQNAPDGETYRFNKTNPNDKVQVDKTDKSNIFTKQNKDGSWRIDFGKPRIDIHTKDAGILPDKPLQLNNMSNGNKIQSWNYSKLKDIGYWYKPSDWKNIEVTLIFKIVDSARSKGEQHSLSIVTRSITHSQLDNEYKKSKDEPKYFCGGSSYHNNISNDGNARMKKEQYHINYEWERYNDEMLNVGDIYDKIIGFKGIVYNVNDTAVKLETWVDVENGGKGPYKKVHELIDNGNWGDAMKECGAETNGQAITWGSPIVILKANDFKFDIYDVEIREIIPPSSI
jgi:hypothetical protein